MSSGGSGVDDLKALLESSVGNMDFHGSTSSLDRQGIRGGSIGAGGGIPSRQEKKTEIPVLDELASLIGSVDFDLNPAKKSSRNLPTSGGVDLPSVRLPQFFIDTFHRSQRPQLLPQKILSARQQIPS
jgi:hypothetical protein